MRYLQLPMWMTLNILNVQDIHVQGREVGMLN